MIADPRVAALRSIRAAAQELLVACMAVTPHVAVHLHRAFDTALHPNDAADEVLLRIIDVRDGSRH